MSLRPRRTTGTPPSTLRDDPGIISAVTDVVHGLGGPHRARAVALRAERRFFWLDASLQDTGRDDLREVLGVPEAALEAVRRPGAILMTPSVHADGECVAFDIHCHVPARAGGAAGEPGLRPVAVPVVITAGYLLTLHEDGVSLPSALALHATSERGNGYAVYSALDAMLGSNFSALGEVGLSPDALAETSSDKRGGSLPRAKLRVTVATLAAMRRWATAEQAVFDRAGLEIVALPGFGSQDESYFDRLDEQVDRLVASIDAAADGLGMLLDLQLTNGRTS